MRIFIFACLFIQAEALYAQAVVSQVEFAGLTHTRERFVKRFVSQKEGDTFDSTQLANDRQRLLNLNIFSTVDSEVTEGVQGVKVVFHFQEMINTLPVFALGQTEETFWCRVGLQSLNLTGRADKLVAYYQYYDRHSVFLSYTTDRIGSSNWGFSASAIKWSTVEPLVLKDERVDYNYSSYTSYASAIRFFGFRESLEMGSGFFNERFEPRVGTPESSDIVQGNKAIAKLIFRSNRVDFNSFYADGFYNQLNIEFIHSLDELRNFFIAFNEFRYFKKLGSRWNWANRLRLGISTNDPNPFAPFVLDSYLNIRGVGNRVDRGTGSMVVNTEWRYTVFDESMLAAQAVAFVDFGTWRQPGGTFSDFRQSKNMRAFTGMGFRLIYKRAFDTMLRVDVGYDYNERTGVVIGIGQYF